MLMLLSILAINGLILMFADQIDFTLREGIFLIGVLEMFIAIIIFIINIRTILN